jgi:hypothetical protein
VLTGQPGKPLSKGCNASGQNNLMTNLITTAKQNFSQNKRLQININILPQVKQALVTAQVIMT